MSKETSTPKEKKISSSLLDRLTKTLQLSDDDIQRLRDEEIAVGGTRRGSARYFPMEDGSKVTPSFSFKGIGDNKPTSEMKKLRTEVDGLISKYTITDWHSSNRRIIVYYNKGVVTLS